MASDGSCDIEFIFRGGQVNIMQVSFQETVAFLITHYGALNMLMVQLLLLMVHLGQMKQINGYSFRYG